jgi:hypothetical protein
MRRVVCAATKIGDYHMLVGARHWDLVMRDQWRLVQAFTPHDPKEEQGFIDQHGVFMSRTVAWKVAEAAGQIVRRCGGDDANDGTLYSENLY